MKLLLLFGHMAVGKMTVGQELAKITELRLFHNHMTIEPVLEVFGEFRWDTIERLRHVFFEDFAASGKYGMIFTFMWGFDQQSEWEYVERITEILRCTTPIYTMWNWLRQKKLGYNVIRRKTD